MTTLIGYASAKGSTRGIAERIASVLGRTGPVAGPIPLGEVTSVEQYEALVLGSAIHNGRWLPEAAGAVDSLGASLAGRAVWMYSVSSVGATSTILSPRVAGYLRPVTPEPEVVRHLRTVARVRDHRFFAGAITPGDWPGVGRVVFRMVGGRYGDARDWADIEAWADAIGRDIARSKP